MIHLTEVNNERERANGTNSTKTFNPLWISIKFPVCNVPFNMDAYRHCSFDCIYCYSKNRGIIDTSKINDKPNIKWMKNKLEKVFDEKNPNPNNFIDMLLKNNITIKGGVTSDCFQPREESDLYTKQIVEILNDYNRTILFNTKADTVYDVPITPKLHSFQLSVSNVYDLKEFEPNVPAIKNRIRFYDELKDNGFKVNIRIQPLIPNVSDFKIMEAFKNADYYSLGCIYLQHRNHDAVEKVLNVTGLTLQDFTTTGSMRIKPEIREHYYQKFGNYLDEIGVTWNVSDPYMHRGTDACCCGDKVVPHPLPFSNMTLIKKYGWNYTLDNVYDELGDFADCRCDSMFTSNRREGLHTVKEYYERRFDRQSSPFSPKHTLKPVKTEKTLQSKLI